MPSDPIETEMTAPCGLRVRKSAVAADYARGVTEIVAGLDRARGVVLSSSFEYPSRYTRWDIAFRDPPLAVEVRAGRLTLEALNRRGQVLLPPLAEAVGAEMEGERADLALPAPQAPDSEEARTRSSALFEALRRLLAAMALPEDPHLGLYGAWGYDLVQQLDPVPQRLARDPGQRDLVLYLPDELFVVDHVGETCTRLRYDFALGAARTDGLPREGTRSELGPPRTPDSEGDHGPGEYARAVELARARFLAGEMFECVLTQTFRRRCELAPSEVFSRLKAANPAPYGCLMNLGQGEFLVAASPEMFVRVRGRTVETCPISGTIARGRDALGDARQILTLLNSGKDESELTMCTDVDRNDKSRVCAPGSVRVIGRRQVELYSRLIHTVDHVEGRLRDDCDALDAFLTHAWAVTVTGAPKRAARQFIEETERGARRWYGGAIGSLGFNGDLNTGLTLRALRLSEGVAEARVGATLLWDSVPEDEDAEARLKISAMLAALERPHRGTAAAPRADERPLAGRRVLMVDHEDSFVLMLGDYLRQLGGAVTTLRPEAARRALSETKPDLVMLSPGPGRPADFDLEATIAAARGAGLPLFGVCLGLQGLVEHFGGHLRLADEPVHGKASRIWLQDAAMFAGLPATIEVGRYHSLYARSGTLPAELVETARTDDGMVMALRHRRAPIAAVQFHPESIMTQEEDHGLRILANAANLLLGQMATAKAV